MRFYSSIKSGNDPKKMGIRYKLFLLSFVLLIGNVLMGYCVYKSNKKLRESEVLIEQSRQSIVEINDLFLEVREIQLASYKLVITNDSSYIKTLNAALEKSTADLKIIKADKKNSIKKGRIDSLQAKILDYINFILRPLTTEVLMKETASLHLFIQKEKYYEINILQQLHLILWKESEVLNLRNENNVACIKKFNYLIICMFFALTVLLLVLLDLIGRSWFQGAFKVKTKEALDLANKKIGYQRGEKKQRDSELIIANKELIFQNDEKEKRASELILANIELAYQNKEKEKRSQELNLANLELAYQNKEKENRATELFIANSELAFQNQEKEKRANELLFANIELAYQNQEKEKRERDLIEANKELEQIEQAQEEYITGLEKMMYMISHEIRLPVTQILGLASLLDKTLNLSVAVKTMLKYIRESAETLDVYTRDFTSYVSNIMNKQKSKKSPK